MLWIIMLYCFPIEEVIRALSIPCISPFHFHHISTVPPASNSSFFLSTPHTHPIHVEWEYHSSFHAVALLPQGKPTSLSAPRSQKQKGCPSTSWALGVGKRMLMVDKLLWILGLQCVGCPGAEGLTKDKGGWYCGWMALNYTKKKKINNFMLLKLITLKYVIFLSFPGLVYGLIQRFDINTQHLHYYD